MPLDPAREWLAAGITGLQRQREWDAVATLALDGVSADEVAFVALADGTYVHEAGLDEDLRPFAEALGDDVERPYRALAVRRPGVWAVGAVAIDVDRLDPDPRGGELELTWNGSELALAVDGVPADPLRADALERVARTRISGPFAAHARRVRDDLWELSVLAL